VRLAEAVHGSRMAELSIGFPFAAPAWAERLEAALPYRCRYGGIRLVFEFDTGSLEQPSVTMDPGIHADAIRECERQLAAMRKTTLSDRVRLYLRSREDRWPSLEEVAGFFNVSARTVIRRLKTEGCTFQQLLDELRAERSAWYLRNTSLSVEEIASRMGYLDTTNFSRAFRRWHRMTPTEARPLMNAGEAGSHN